MQKTILRVSLLKENNASLQSALSDTITTKHVSPIEHILGALYRIYIWETKLNNDDVVEYLGCV